MLKAQSNSLYILFVSVILHLPNILGSDSTNLRGETDLMIEVTQILDNITEHYDRRLRPNFGGNPIEVGLTMYVLAFHNIIEVDMEYTLDFYFRQMWNDPRLRFEAPFNTNLTTLNMEDPDFIQKIWVPDTFFPNQKPMERESTTEDEFIRISSNGDVLDSKRLTMTLSCPMDLRYFPMDQQLCTLEIESYGYTMSDISFVWAEGDSEPVGVSPTVSLPQFRVLGYKRQAKQVSLTTGNYSRLSVEFLFQRSVGYFIIGWYFPSAVVVVLAYLAFWLDGSQATERVAMGATSVLTISFLWTSINESLPKISYIKAIDIYIGMCFLFCFATTLVSVAGGYCRKLVNRFNYKPVPTEEDGTANLEEAQDGSFHFCLHCTRAPHYIDRCARLGFPILFTGFNVWYWKSYMIDRDPAERPEFTPLL